MTQDLLDHVFFPAFCNTTLDEQGDAALLPASLGRLLESFGGGDARLAVTTDAYVVTPLFFPGGDIGSLAVHGTLNDLAVSGAKPLCIVAAFVIEEGLAMDDLERIVGSMHRACADAEVELVAGDTKVVERGKADGVFITTTGLGVRPTSVQLGAELVRPGDAVLVSGSMGDHGVAILAKRAGIDLETPLESDSASLLPLTELLLRRPGEVRWMRDATRGGLASIVNELAIQTNLGVVIDERAVPVKAPVRGACELLGIDPLHVANEGKLVAVVSNERAQALVERLKQQALGRDAAIIGRVTEEHPRLVRLRSQAGGERVLHTLYGEQLPRIC